MCIGSLNMEKERNPIKSRVQRKKNILKNDKKEREKKGDPENQCVTDKLLKCMRLRLICKIGNNLRFKEF